jgi:hypothetical protein
MVIGAQTGGGAVVVAAVVVGGVVVGGGGAGCVANAINEKATCALANAPPDDHIARTRNVVLVNESAM